MHDNCCLRCGQELRLAVEDNRSHLGEIIDFGRLCGKCLATMPEEEHPYWD